MKSQRVKARYRSRGEKSLSPDGGSQSIRFFFLTPLQQNTRFRRLKQFTNIFLQLLTSEVPHRPTAGPQSRCWRGVFLSEDAGEESAFLTLAVFVMPFELCCSPSSTVGNRRQDFPRPRRLRITVTMVFHCVPSLVWEDPNTRTIGYN